MLPAGYYLADDGCMDALVSGGLAVVCLDQSPFVRIPELDGAVLQSGRRHQSCAKQVIHSPPTAAREVHCRHVAHLPAGQAVCASLVEANA